jgi:hypothetical protein
MAASKNINGIDEAQIRQLIDGWAKALRAVGQKIARTQKAWYSEIEARLLLFRE